MSDKDDIDRAGVGLAQFLAARHVGTFREQQTSDYGVDAHVEFRDADANPTGRLIGAQLKSGSSWFEEPSDDGWIFRPKKRHITYWLGHSLPMYVLLADVDNGEVYWQEVSERTLQTGPRGGRFINVPRTQTLANARDTWVAAADKFAQLAGADYEENLDHVSPTTARLLREFATNHPDSAALLAAHLARGRATPELVVRTLLDSKPVWLLAGDKGEGLGVVAQYANSHNLPSLAVEALAAVIAVDGTDKYKHTRTSGLLLLGEDRARAKHYLDEAQAMPDSAGDVRLAIGFASLEHPATSAAPVPVSPELRAQLESAVDDEVAVTFLAGQAELRGDYETSVRLHERALSLDPNATGYMQRLAHALIRRGHSPYAHADDSTRAVDLASKAVEQLHSWAGPTEDALATLLQAQIDAGRIAAALDSALPSPQGRATAGEAQRPRVQAVAALAARTLGRYDIVDAILREMPDGVDRDLVQLRVRDHANPDETRAAWLDMVTRLDISRPEDLLIAVLRLAEHGIDESSRLDLLVERGMLKATLQSSAAVIARANNDLDSNLPDLRVLAETEEVAAGKLLELLLRAERFEDAEVAADAAMNRFSNPDFALFRIDALDAQGRIDEAEAALNDVLANSTLDPFNTRLAHRRLADITVTRIEDAADAATRTRLLLKAERHATACVEQPDLPVDDRDVWRLAELRIRIGQPEAAFAVITDHDPAFIHSWHGRLWLDLARQQATLPTSAYARMLDLADQFADDIELSAQLLSTVTMTTRDAEDNPASPQDRRNVLPCEMRAAAFAALQQHLARHGEDSPIKVVEASTTEALIEQMTAMMRRDDAPLVELLELVRQAQLPIGVIASVIGRPYASTYAERPLGYYLAAPALDEDDDADEAAARNATNSDIVVDASALLVSTELGEYDKVRGRFRRILIPTVSVHDIARGRDELDGRSSSAGFINYNAATDSIVASELDVDEHLDTLTRFAALENAAESPQRVADVSLDSIAEIDLPNAEPWLAPIALAKERGVPLWSDDLAQRRLARAVGVQAFATTTLQHIRTVDQIDRADSDAAVDEIMAAKRAETATLIQTRIVDLPVDSDLIIEVGRDFDWDEPIALVTIGRPGWWHMTDNPYKELRQVLRQVHADDGPHEKWRYHAMWGVARLASDDPSRAAILIAAVALTPLDDTTTDFAAVAKYLTVAGEIATYRKAHQPSEYLAEAATFLAGAGVLTDAAATVANARAALDAQASSNAPDEVDPGSDRQGS